MASIKVFQEVLKRPIAYHGVLARMLKSPTAAIMLSQGIYWQGKAEEKGDYYFYVTGEQWYKQTGLTLENQMTARKLMSKKGIWLEVRKGVPARMFYRIDIVELWSQLEQFVEAEERDLQIQEMPKSAISDSPNQVSVNNQNKSQGLPGTIIKTNKEINKDYIENNSANALLDYLIEDHKQSVLSNAKQKPLLKEEKKNKDVHRADVLKKSLTYTKEEFLQHLEQRGVLTFYDSFKMVWADYVEHRRELRKPYKSAKSAALGFKELLEKSDYKLDAATRLVERTIAYGYQGLHPEKEQKQTIKNKVQEQHEDLVSYVMQKRTLLNG